MMLQCTCLHLSKAKGDKYSCTVTIPSPSCWVLIQQKGHFYIWPLAVLVNNSATPYVYDLVGKSSQGYQKDSGSCYLGLHFLSIMGYSREQVPLCKAVLLWCSNITSHLINTFPPPWKMEWGGFSEKGLERNESNERREDKGKATQEIKNPKNTRRESGSNAKPVESEHRHWGNQKSSEPVCVVGVRVCAFMFAVLFLAQFCPNKAQNKPQNKHGRRQFPNSQHTCHNWKL